MCQPQAVDLPEPTPNSFAKLDLPEPKNLETQTAIRSLGLLGA